MILTFSDVVVFLYELFILDSGNSHYLFFICIKCFLVVGFLGVSGGLRLII